MTTGYQQQSVLLDICWSFKTKLVRHSGVLLKKRWIYARNVPSSQRRRSLLVETVHYGVYYIVKCEKLLGKYTLPKKHHRLVYDVCPHIPPIHPGLDMNMGWVPNFKTKITIKVWHSLSTLHKGLIHIIIRIRTLVQCNKNSPPTR